MKPTITQREFILRLVYCATLFAICLVAATNDVLNTRARAESQIEIENTRPRKAWVKEKE